MQNVQSLQALLHVINIFSERCDFFIYDLDLGPKDAFRKLFEQYIIFFQACYYKVFVSKSQCCQIEWKAYSWPEKKNIISLYNFDQTNEIFQH